MALNRAKAKGRRETGRFAGIPHVVMKHPDYIGLSYPAKSLLFELALQYNGYNNGNLTAAWSVMLKRGWRSKSTLSRALDELKSKNLISLTRSGWFANPGSRCALYALTWQAIDDCQGKQLEISATIRPLRSFN